MALGKELHLTTHTQIYCADIGWLPEGSRLDVFVQAALVGPKKEAQRPKDAISWCYLTSVHVIL